MNDALERIWKEVVLIYSRYYPGISLERLKKTAEKLIHYCRVSNRNEHFQNSNPERYRR
jgi:hypothetical protein